MPASEAPNVVRIKSYINCFVKIEGIKVVCVKSAPSNMRRSSARDLEKQNSQTNMTVRGFFFFMLSSFCLLFDLLRLGVQELSQLISSVLLPW